MPSVQSVQQNVQFTKNIIREGLEDQQLVNGDVCEIQIKLLLDPQVLRTEFFSSDSLLGISGLRMDEPISCFIKLGYYNTQIMRTVHEIVQQMRVQELAVASFEMDPDQLDEGLKRPKRIDGDKKVYLDLGFELNLVRQVKENFEGLQLTGTILKPEEYFKIDETFVYRINEFELADLCDFHKKDANELFKRGFVRTAFNRYHKSISMLIIAQQQADFNRALASEDKVTLPDGHDLLFDRLARTKVQLYSNLSACQLRSKNFQLARVNCNKCLEADPVNVKAMFRRAQACMSLNEFELARSDLNRAGELAPADVEIKRQLIKLKELEKQYALKQKQYALNLQKMFN